MSRRAFAVALLCLFLTASVLSAELPEVLQPNMTAFSAAQVTMLKQGITVLKATLSNTRLGSRRLFASNGWQARDFAEYTAGTLAEKGYAVQLASQAGGPDGVHTWVLVGVSLGSETAWVPVEPSPESNKIQQHLGHVPSYSDSGGNLWFESEYLAFNVVEAPPRNLPPVAKIRLPSSLIAPRETAKFIALGASDPDGEIVLFLWGFGDGTTIAGTSPLVRHAYDKEGNYTVSLIVIDNRGKSATTSVVASVGKRREWHPQEDDTGGCGCGK